MFIALFHEASTIIIAISRALRGPALLVACGFAIQGTDCFRREPLLHGRTGPATMPATMPDTDVVGNFLKLVARCPWPHGILSRQFPEFSV